MEMATKVAVSIFIEFSRLQWIYEKIVYLQLQRNSIQSQHKSLNGIYGYTNR